MTSIVERVRDLLPKLEQPRRYSFRLNHTAEVYLRRLSWPHKWRGRGRSIRHLRAVRAYMRALEDYVNTPEMCALFDRAVDQRFGQP